MSIDILFLGLRKRKWNVMEEIFYDGEEKNVKTDVIYDVNYEELSAEIDKETCFDRKVEG